MPYFEEALLPARQVQLQAQGPEHCVKRRCFVSICSKPDPQKFEQALNIEPHFLGLFLRAHNGVIVKENRPANFQGNHTYKSYRCWQTQEGAHTCSGPEGKGQDIKICYARLRALQRYFHAICTCLANPKLLIRTFEVIRSPAKVCLRKVRIFHIHANKKSSRQIFNRFHSETLWQSDSPVDTTYRKIIYKSDFFFLLNREAFGYMVVMQVNIRTGPQPTFLNLFQQFCPSQSARLNGWIQPLPGSTQKLSLVSASQS